MGVTGLWRLLEPAGKPVPLEALENKVLAVDISIWLYQMVKGFQDSRGASIANAHLLGLFQRLCKLLYYRIKPVFVFDGGFPILKKQTILKRQNKKSQMHNNIDRVRKHLLDVLTKQIAVNKVISEKSISPTKKSPRKMSPLKAAHLAAEDEDLFKLPPMKDGVLETAEADNSSGDSSSEESSPSKHSHIDLHSLDVNSEYFKQLTSREKHDLLSELKETRKQNSWGRLHELPSESNNFSDFQMKRLLKRRQVQVALEETEKEMGGHYLSLNELEILLNEEGISTKIENIPTRRIASDENVRFLLIKDVKQAIEMATKKESDKKLESENVKEVASQPSTSKVDQDVIELGDEFDDDLKAAIKLSLQPPDDAEPSDSAKESSVDLTFLGSDYIYSSDSEWSTDEESDNDINVHGAAELALAKAYMLENSGLSEYEIMRIINTKSRQKKKSKFKNHHKNVSILRESQTLPLGLITNDNKEEMLSETKNSNESKEVPFSEPDKCNSILGEQLEVEEKSSVIDLKENERKIPAIFEVHTSNDQELSSSDTDDSFEDVPEACPSPCTNVYSTMQLTLEANTHLEDDIFADIFQEKNEVFDINVEKPDAVKPLDRLVETSYKSNQILDNKVNDKLVNNNVKIDDVQKISGSTISMSNENFSNSKQSESIANEKEPEIQAEDTIVLEDNVPSKINDTSSKVLEQSPNKGMTLNEIRHIASQEDNSFKNKPTSESSQTNNQTISTEELSGLADDLELQREQLEKQKNKLDRMGRNISDEMTKDVQDLLQIFGIPYIVAPMEAEAQCAFLETAELTDGTITDDSDIWLFGGKTVYKNFFNQQKYVLQFLSENIHQCFKLKRDQLILLALLVGSDYTTGVVGVGPVTAMEILAAFPSSNTDPKPPYTALLAGLKKFRCWWSSNRAFGHNSLRNKLKNISLTEDFPSFRVVDAYLTPEIESSNEPFSWGQPDVTALREYAREKFGWNQHKSDEVLNPVLKRLNEKISQQSIRSFFRTDLKTTAVREKMSSRIKKAVERIGNDQLNEDEAVSKPKKPRKPRQKKVVETVKNTLPDDTSNKVDQIKDVANATSSSNNIINLKTDDNIPSSSSPAPKKKPRKRSNPNAQELKMPRLPERHQEKIPQREVDKNILMKNKLKAIELFRTSKKGPGFVKRRKMNKLKPKDDAELSESSSD